MNNKSRKKSFSLLKKISRKNFKGSILRYAITVFSCVTIIVMGTGMLAYATTSIGENIITNILTATGLTVNGTATTTNLVVDSGTVALPDNSITDAMVVDDITITNALYSTDSYSNPNWLTTLGADKLTSGTIPNDRISGLPYTNLSIADDDLTIAKTAGLQTALDGKMANPMTVAEDLIIGGADGVPARLGKGGEGTVLGISSGVLSWISSSASNFLGLSDTPVNYTSQAGKIVKVNSGADGLEFVDADYLLLAGGTVTGDLTVGGNATTTGSHYVDNNLSVLGNASTTGSLYVNGNIGIGTDSPDAELHLKDGSILAEGTTGVTPTSGAGTRMMWIPTKMAFRAGNITGTEWDDENIGNYSVAFGYNGKASTDLSTHFGSNGNITGYAGTHFGYGGVVSNSIATHFGQSGTASGIVSTHFGNNGIASGNYSTHFGEYGTASGIVSTHFGSNGIASGNYSTHFGNNGIAAGDFSWVGGKNMQLTADADRTFAFGYSDTAVSITQPDAFIIYSSDVGIGTTTPATALDVNGGIRADQLTADPCGSGYPEGTMFYNDTSNYYCYCDGTNDVKLHDPATACF